MTIVSYFKKDFFSDNINIHVTVTYGWQIKKQNESTKYLEKHIAKKQEH